MATKKNLSQLGAKINVLLVHFSLNQSQLAQRLNIANSFLWDLMHEHPPEEKKATKGGITFWNAIRREFPDCYDYLDGIDKFPPWEKDETYPITEQRMIAPKVKDADYGETGRSDIGSRKIIEQISPSIKKDIEKVEAILKSPHTDIVAALRANILVFHRMVHIEKELEEIKKSLNPPDGIAEPKRGRRKANE